MKNNILLCKKKCENPTNRNSKDQPARNHAEWDFRSWKTQILSTEKKKCESGGGLIGGWSEIKKSDDCALVWMYDETFLMNQSCCEWWSEENVS